MDVVENSVTASLKSHDGITEDSRCYFPHLPPGESVRYGDLVYDSGKVKSGCHDPKGMMILYGPGIEAGMEIRECNNLDIAPTLLALLDLPIPAELKGRVLAEAFSGAGGWGSRDWGNSSILNPQPQAPNPQSPELVARVG
jgi:hypothetical protein